MQNELSLIPGPDYWGFSYSHEVTKSISSTNRFVKYWVRFLFFAFYHYNSHFVVFPWVNPAIARWAKSCSLSLFTELRKKLRWEKKKKLYCYFALEWSITTRDTLKSKIKQLNDLPFFTSYLDCARYLYQSNYAR